MADPISVRWLLRAALILWALLLTAVVAGRVLNRATGDAVLYDFNVVGAWTFTLLGALIVPRRPRNPVGWLFIVIGLVSAGVLVTATFSGYRAMAWAYEWLPGVAFALLPLALLLFPDGRLPSRRWRAVVFANVAGLVVAVLFLAWAVWEVPGLLVDADPPLTQRAEITWGIARVGLIVVLGSTIAAVASLVVRWRRAEGDTRQQLKWLAAGAAVIPVALVLEIPPLEFDALEGGIAIAIPAVATVAILKHRLYDIDLYLNRSLVYATLTLLVVGAYVVIVRVAGAVVASGAEQTSPLVATGIIALLFHPLRERVQRGANRLLYGDRDDPYAVLSSLGDELVHVGDPAAVLPRIAATVADALQLPYVAIELTGGDTPRLVASHGRQGIAPEAFPMVYQEQVVGRLLASPRTPSQPFTTAELRLLEGLARQAGVAAHAVRLTADLQRSRERLIRSREEERRRLRRELHDGLGPTLAGMTMQVGATRALRAVDDDAVDGLLGELEKQLRTCVAEVRRLVEDLRPPVLDQHGLPRAIRQQINAFSAAGSAPEITLRVPSDLGELPAAVEVAAYRITTEAITNTVRHAGARHCDVSLTLSDHLVIEVDDDGVGLDGGDRVGVGLVSMRERAEELGGSFLAERAPGGGTHIRAQLPLRSQ